MRLSDSNKIFNVALRIEKFAHPCLKRQYQGVVCPAGIRIRKDTLRVGGWMDG